MPRMLLIVAILFLSIAVSAEERGKEAAASRNDSSGARLPTLNVQTLDDHAVSLPRDFSPQRTLLLVEFSKDQAKASETWINALIQPGVDDAWFELAVVGDENAFVRGFILESMRKSHPALKARAHTAAAFSSQKEFIRSTKLTDGAGVNYALVVDQEGTVEASVSGPYSPDKARPILAALQGRAAPDTPIVPQAGITAKPTP